MKTCSRCGKEKELFEYTFSCGKYYSACKKCRAYMSRSNYKKIVQEPKTCVICGAKFTPKIRVAKICSSRKCWRIRNASYLNKYYSTPEGREKHIARVIKRDKNIPIPDAETLEHMAWCREQLCSYCWRRADTVDHVVPISNGGPNHWSNIVPSCRSCNSSKQDISLLEFLYD